MQPNFSDSDSGTEQRPPSPQFMKNGEAAQEEEVEAIEIEDGEQIFIVSKEELNDSVSSHQVDDDEDYEIFNYIDEDYQMAILLKQRDEERIRAEKRRQQ